MPALGNVVIVKFTLISPAGTVTLAGTLAAPRWLLPSVTANPPAGATAASWTVPIARVPPVTLEGTMKDDNVAAGGGVPDGFTVRSANRVTPPPLTEILTTVVVDTEAGRICTNRLVLPLGTWTPVDKYGSTAALLLVTLRYWSKDADVAIVTVPSDDPCPPTTVAGKIVNAVGAGPGVIVTGVCTAAPFHAAVMVTTVLDVTLLVGSVNGAE